MKQLLCLGDSITDCGRILEYPPLGNGYVQMLAEMPYFQGWEILNKGMDGFTAARVLELASRLYTSLSPDMTTLLIGINDIGLMMNTGRTESQIHSMHRKFCRTCEQILDIICRNQKPVILMEPFIFPYPLEYRRWMPHVRIMSQNLQTLAQKYRISFLPLQAELEQMALAKDFSAITTDGIHLTCTGQRFLAEKLHQASFDLNIKKKSIQK